MRLTAIGHFNIIGFELLKNVLSDRGLEIEDFKQFKSVFSGHYHIKNKKVNVDYLGSPFYLTWHDYNRPKGFHFWDFNTLEFIENTYKVYVQLDYTKNFDFNLIKDKISKIYVKEKDRNTKYYEKFLTDIVNVPVIDYTIFEETKEISFVENDKGEDENMDTFENILKFTDSFEVPSNISKDLLTKQMIKLYKEVEMNDHI